MLSIVGFFLWVIRNFIRGLRQKSQFYAISPLSEPDLPAEKKRIDWPVHIFLSKEDDIPIPGRWTHISQVDAFMESSARLVAEQQISLYVNVPEQEPVHLTAKVIWARRGCGGVNATQLTFASHCAGVMKTLHKQA